ncbi:MAG: hypothetical protein M9951_16870 [Burkholderiaceae bacterium]|nr:hypothetical protein [Burkholderiaceae bacterium]
MDIEERVASLETSMRETWQVLLMLADAGQMHERVLGHVLYYQPEALDRLRAIMDNEVLLTTSMPDEEIQHFERFWAAVMNSIAARDAALAAQAAEGPDA